MKTLLKKYKRKWLSHLDYSFDTYLPITDKNILENPFDYLPPVLSLSSEEQEELKQIEETSQDWTGDEVIRMQMLRLKRGWYWKEEGHQYIEKYLNEITQQANKLGITLPINLLKFYQDNMLINRIRWSHSFSFREKIVPFPEQKGLFLLTFIIENQGCCYWYILLDKQGNHCILYNNHPWDTQPSDILPDDGPFEYYICADSFEDFIVRLSQELIKREQQPRYNKYFK